MFQKDPARAPETGPRRQQSRPSAPRKARRRRSPFVYLCLALVLILALVLSLVSVPGIRRLFVGPGPQSLLLLQPYNLRAEPSQDGTRLAILPVGELLDIEAEVTGEDTAYGQRWYKLRYRGLEAYLVVDAGGQRLLERSRLQRADKVQENADWETQLASFPTAYQDRLDELHRRHPNWQFQAVPVDKGFQQAVEEQLENEARNLLPQSSFYSYMLANKTVYDSPDWSPVGEAALTYFMDPRSYLCESLIFAYEDVGFRLEGKEQEEELRALYKGVPELEDLVPELLEAAEKSDLSPLFLGSRVRQEQYTGQGLADTALGTREVDGRTGFYNLYNIGATGGAEPRDEALRFAQTGRGLSAEEQARYLLPWDTRQKALVGGALWIRDHYTREQPTLYLQKFNVTGDPSHQYMQNVLAPTEEAEAQFLSCLQSGQFSRRRLFRIPVFQDLPAEHAFPSWD